MPKIKGHRAWIVSVPYALKFHCFDMLRLNHNPFPLALLPIFGALAITGCSSEPPEINHAQDDQKWIEFAVPEVETRAYDGITTTLNIPNFKVSASTQGQWSWYYLMENVVVTRTGINSWTYSPKIEWPDKPVNFYEVYPTDLKWTIFGWDRGAELITFENTGKTDVVIGAQYDVMRQSAPVKINFRHILSVVDVSLKADIPSDMTVLLRRAYIQNVADYGAYVYPKQSTDPVGDIDSGDPAVSGSWQAWGFKNFRIFAAPDLDAGHPLKSSDGYLPLDSDSVRFMIPQTLQEVGYNWQWYGSCLMAVYKILDSKGNTVWPNESTSYEYKSNDDPGWGLAQFDLYEATPDHKWLPGINYSYRLTLKSPL